jgi:mono/diheme cytochrome c family protein
MGCHTPDGSGEPGRVPSIKETLVPFALNPNGRRFLIQVPGASQSTLTDAELAALLNWMVQNLSVIKPARFTRFTEAEVASLASYAARGRAGDAAVTASESEFHRSGFSVTNMFW